MKKLFAACCAAFLLVVLAAPIAHAATEVNVRIEGRAETLFEGTIPVGIHPIEAASDTQTRDCDGVNALDPGNTEPGITPTLASAEAMESIGETFDGEWYDGFGDYFITRWGPDAQDNATGAYWGVLVNNVLTSVGGCQYQLSQDDEALWLYDAFASRPLLALFPEAAHYAEGPRPTLVAVAPGEPVPLEVVAYPAGGEGIAAESPSRTGSAPYAGATVAPVTVSAEGFQRVDTASPDAVTTDADGKTSVTYEEPGLYRVKATVGEPGHEGTVVRSNGLEICVEVAAGECDGGAAPGSGGAGPGTGTGSGQVPGTGTGSGGDSGSTGSTDRGSGSTAPTTGGGSTVAAAQASSPVKLGGVRLDRAALAGGQLKLSWKVLDPGAGLRSWRVSTRTLGAMGGWVERGHGTTQTAATVRLPRGHRYRVRLTVTDRAGHSTAYGLGKATVPGAGRD
jgi:hypothetical protein